MRVDAGRRGRIFRADLFTESFSANQSEDFTFGDQKMEIHIRKICHRQFVVATLDLLLVSELLAKHETLV